MTKASGKFSPYSGHSIGVSDLRSGHRNMHSRKPSCGSSTPTSRPLERRRNECAYQPPRPDMGAGKSTSTCAGSWSHCQVLYQGHSNVCCPGATFRASWKYIVPVHLATMHGLEAMSRSCACCFCDRRQARQTSNTAVRPTNPIAKPASPIRIQIEGIRIACQSPAESFFQSITNPRRRFHDLRYSAASLLIAASTSSRDCDLLWDFGAGART
jgi:hypothetical protein